MIFLFKDKFDAMVEKLRFLSQSHFGFVKINSDGKLNNSEWLSNNWLSKVPPDLWICAIKINSLSIILIFLLKKSDFKKKKN